MEFDLLCCVAGVVQCRLCFRLLPRLVWFWFRVGSARLRGLLCRGVDCMCFDLCCELLVL